MRKKFILFVVLILIGTTVAQTGNSSNNAPGQQSQPSMEMPADHGMSNMKDMPMNGDKDDRDGDEAGAHVMHSMEGRMDMGPHMKMTSVRQPKPGDAQRAQRVVDAARSASEKYKDYHTALADGFQVFLPNVPQKVYHFTNYEYADRG
jgi:hypothetical protein